MATSTPNDLFLEGKGPSHFGHDLDLPTHSRLILYFGLAKPAQSVLATLSLSGNRLGVKKSPWHQRREEWFNYILIEPFS